MKSTKSVKHSAVDIFDAVIEHFPYELMRTGCTQGDLETFYDDEFREYSEEFTFEIGRLLDTPLIAGGWIDIRQNEPDEEIYISAFFSIALDGDFKNSKILSDDKALQGYYNPDTHTWDLEIGVY